MKRTLHGKRHIRARWTVQAGREKRKQRKFDRSLMLLKKAIARMFLRTKENPFFVFGQRLSEFASSMTKIMADFGATVGKVAYDIQNYKDNEHG